MALANSTSQTPTLRLYVSYKQPENSIPNKAAQLDYSSTLFTLSVELSLAGLSYPASLSCLAANPLIPPPPACKCLPIYNRPQGELARHESSLAWLFRLSLVSSDSTSPTPVLCGCYFLCLGVSPVTTLPPQQASLHHRCRARQ